MPILNKKIIAILGLPGSGKTEAINYLMKKYGWPKVYFGDITFDEIKKRNLEINEKNERSVREELRARYGQLHYAKQVIKKIKKIRENFVLVESLYSWDEYLLFKKKFGKNFLTIAVYSSPEIRYGRLKNRPVRSLTSKEATSRDYAQIENLKQGGPIAIADFTITNNKNLKFIYLQADKIIQEIK